MEWGQERYKGKWKRGEKKLRGRWRRGKNREREKRGGRKMSGAIKGKEKGDGEGHNFSKAT